ncbi:DUF2502 domain-containing protein [Serratia sp. T13T92]|jgi:hypothetical protein|uniref:DUF2502 domain-containing protein n=1 Tax=Serratia sp. T13T92 TaxID=3397496 RepID=UPI0039DFC1CB
MKKILLLVCLPLLLPMAAQADVSIDINVPGVSLHLGDQDKRGYYWDGYDWRPPQWWHEHQGRGIGERNDRGLYWDGGRWQPAPERGNEQRGGNPFRGERHDNGNSQKKQQDNGGRENEHDRGNDHQRGNSDNGNGQGKPYPAKGNNSQR